jgi:hypothetical protein
MRKFLGSGMREARDLRSKKRRMSSLRKKADK